MVKWNYRNNDIINDILDGWNKLPEYTVFTIFKCPTGAQI